MQLLLVHEYFADYYASHSALQRLYSPNCYALEHKLYRLSSFKNAKLRSPSLSLHCCSARVSEEENCGDIGKNVMYVYVTSFFEKSDMLSRDYRMGSSLESDLLMTLSHNS